MKPEISAAFFSDKVEFFLGFLPDITQVNFLKLFFYFTSHEKVKIRNFSSFFQLFAAFIEIEKCRLFFAFPRLARLIDSCQEKARNSNQCSCSSFNITVPFQSHLLLNLVPCYII